jgi:predicted secreted hydrolase
VIASGVSRRILVAAAGQAIFLTETAYLHMKTNLLAISTEWWYFTGHLTGTDIFGKPHSYGFELVFVRSNVLDLEPAAALYNGQFAITDLTRGTFDQDTLNDSLEADNVPAPGGYNTTINAWNMHGINGKNHISAFDTNYAINLKLDPSAPAAQHGTTEAIGPDEVSETPLGSWTSPVTGITYPQN